MTWGLRISSCGGPVVVWRSWRATPFSCLDGPEMWVAARGRGKLCLHWARRTWLGIAWVCWHAVAACRECSLGSVVQARSSRNWFSQRVELPGALNPNSCRAWRRGFFPLLSPEFYMCPMLDKSKWAPHQACASAHAWRHRHQQHQRQAPTRRASPEAPETSRNLGFRVQGFGFRV